MSEIDVARDLELAVAGDEDFAEEKLAAVNAAWQEQADSPHRELTGQEEESTPEPVPVIHPGWCDPGLCTAPEFRPTEYAPGSHGEHRSARLAEIYPAEQEVYLSQAIAPWLCTTHLIVGPHHMRLDSASPLLRAILIHVEAFRRDYPSLLQYLIAKPDAEADAAAKTGREVQL